MIARIFIGVGLFILGYFVGKEIGRAESIRDQLSWTAEDDDLKSAEPDSVTDTESDTLASDASDQATDEGGGS